MLLKNLRNLKILQRLGNFFYLPLIFIFSIFHLSIHLMNIDKIYADMIKISLESKYEKNDNDNDIKSKILNISTSDITNGDISAQFSYILDTNKYILGANPFIGIDINIRNKREEKLNFIYGGLMWDYSWSELLFISGSISAVKNITSLDKVNLQKTLSEDLLENLTFRASIGVGFIVKEKHIISIDFNIYEISTIFAKTELYNKLRSISLSYYLKF